jgi:hypothetical protein
VIARRTMPIASSRVKSRASFPSRPRLKFELVVNLKTAKELGPSFAAVHESGSGPSRNVAAMQQFSRFWSEADINR